MQHTALVCKRECRQHAIERHECFGDWQLAAAGQPCGECLARQQLEHEVRIAVVLADVMQRDDVRMEQLRRRTRFTFEQLPHVIVIAVHTEHLERDIAVVWVFDTD